MIDRLGLALLVQRITAPLARKIYTLATRATIVMVDDTGAKQLVQITALNGERLSGVERLQLFGFSGNPPAGCSGLAISIGGSRTHTLFLEGENGNRKSGLQPGESSHYNDFGDYTLLDKDGNYHIHASTKVFVDAPDCETTGNMKVGGNLVVVGDSHVQGNEQVDGTIGATGSISTEADLSAAGDVSDGDSSLADLRDWDAAHQHINGVDGHLTGPPTVAPP
jgi:phage baseplate assembly protein V